MAKKNKKGTLDIKSIGLGALVGDVREAIVDFYHNGSIESVELKVKQLPFSKTDDLHSRLSAGDKDVVADWIALALVDDDGNTMFTSDQIKENFTQALANQVFQEVSGLKGLKEYADKLGKESEVEMKSGQS